MNSVNGRGRWILLAPMSVFFLVMVSLVARSEQRSADPGRRPAVPVEMVSSRLVNATFEVSSSSVQALDFVEPDDDVVLTTVIVDGQTWTLELTRHSIRSSDFQVLVQQDASGALVPVDAPPVQTFHGRILEVPGSRAAGSFVDGRLRVYLKADGEIFGIEPLDNVAAVAVGSANHVVYRRRDRVGSGFRCGLDGFAPLGRESVLSIPPSDTSASGTGLSVTEIAIDTDFEFYQLNQSNVANTVHDIETVLESIEEIYEVPEIGINYETTVVIVRSDPADPYTFVVAGDLLDEMGEVWVSPPENLIHRDTAHLFTGKNLVAPVIGIAPLSVICSFNSGVGLSESRFSSNFVERVGVTAHELGHNWSALHCDGSPGCRIMCSSIGGCTGISTSFGPDSIASIVSFKDTRFCLDDLASPQEAPFFDAFLGTTFDSAKWSFNYANSAKVDSGASNEPTPPNSAVLSRSGPEEFRDDDIRTNFIDLEFVSSPKLLYSTQHVGVESGGELVVEYWSDDFVWEEINRITSDGTDQDEFEPHQHTLPVNGRHTESRMRFRTEIESGHWYIDDVVVAPNSPPFIASQSSDQTVCEGEDAVFTVVALGFDPITYQWFKGGGMLSGETGATLTIASPTPEDAGTYTCEITNPFGTTETGTATLTVITIASCDDGVFCSGIETCSGGQCQSSGDPCTTEEQPFCNFQLDHCVECLADFMCSDGNVCNGAEDCNEEGVCVSVAPVPAGTSCGSQANTLCTAPDTCDGVGTCLTNDMADGASCSDSVFCNGEELCQGGVCEAGENPCVLQVCDDDIDECIASPAVFAVVSASQASPGSAVVVDLFVQNVEELRGYQVSLGVMRTSGAGEIFADCPGAISIDTSRPDYVFATPPPDTLVFPIPDCIGNRVAAALSMGSVAIGGDPKYIGEYKYTVSEDAQLGSTFDINIQTGSTALRDEMDQDISYVIGLDQTVTIVDCTIVTFGDLAGPGSSCGADGLIDINDIFAVLDGFRGLFTPPCTLEDIDLMSGGSVCGGDGLIDIADIFAVLDAFQGIFNCPDPCVSP